MNYSPYFLLFIIIATGTKASAMEACQTWMSLTLSNTESSLDIYMSASNLKPSRFSSSGYPFGAAPPGFQPRLVAWRNNLSSIPPTFPFTVCKPWPSARGMVLVALTAEYQECLKVGPSDVNYSCISAWRRCDCSTRMRCVGTFCWHLSLI